MLTSVEAGRANQRIPDEEVVEFAPRSGRAVLTFNRLDFLRLHRSANAKHAGIIACSIDHDTEALAHRIDRAIREVGVLEGQLLRVNRPAVK